MDNQKQKKKKSVMDTLSATMVLVLIALLLVFVGYTYLALKNGYTLDDLIDNIVDISVGKSGILALKADGTVWTWGQASSGQLGNGETVRSAFPVQVMTDQFTDETKTELNAAIEAFKTQFSPSV